MYAEHRGSDLDVPAWHSTTEQGILGLRPGIHRVVELGNMWIRPSKIGTGLGRVLWQDAMATHGRPVRQAHALFRHRTPDQMLVTAQSAAA